MSTEQPNPIVTAAARMLGALGASKGGKARAKALSKQRRVEIAKRGAKARWNKRS